MYCKEKCLFSVSAWQGGTSLLLPARIENESFLFVLFCFGFFCVCVSFVCFFFWGGGGRGEEGVATWDFTAFTWMVNGSVHRLGDQRLVSKLVNSV